MYISIAIDSIKRTQLHGEMAMSDVMGCQCTQINIKADTSSQRKHI